MKTMKETVRDGRKPVFKKKPKPEPKKSETAPKSGDGKKNGGK